MSRHRQERRTHNTIVKPPLYKFQRRYAEYDLEDEPDIKSICDRASRDIIVDWKGIMIGKIQSETDPIGEVSETMACEGQPLLDRLRGSHDLIIICIIYKTI